MKTDPKNPSPVVGTDDPPKVSLSKAPNARRRGESAGQPGSGVSDETGNLFEPRSEEEERLIDAVLETEERPMSQIQRCPTILITRESKAR
ncbi:hypothetical protein VQ042_25090 [Aurantimonas sp. A2-1-M11]|uniref:hypothetical protein n=1 Tax=Aurantimonas sp. A2-1-M11 TaxID=3113712 RepID=UPI002F93B411